MSDTVDRSDETPARVSLSEAFHRLRDVDERTDAGFTSGLRDALLRFVEAFDEVWESDATFRERWRPRSTRIRQILSGRYLDRRLNEIARSSGIVIDRQLSEHGGHWDFIGCTRYKGSKGGRSLKLRGAFEPTGSSTCRAAVGTRDAGYRRGEGTYSIAELIVSPGGELLMLERDVTGGARHLWAYYVDGFRNRRASDDDRVTSPDIMDARMLLDPPSGGWVHRTGPIRVHRTWLRTGDTPEWRAGARWLDGDPESGIVVVPDASAIRRVLDDE
ncbi:MAG: hypothetical protein AAGD33_16280 [Actinomycetota bacterium]